MKPEMTLRQYYAGQALVGLLSNPVTREEYLEGREVEGDHLLIGAFETHAGFAFTYADAMIEVDKRTTRNDDTPTG